MTKSTMYKRYRFPPERGVATTKGADMMGTGTMPDKYLTGMEKPATLVKKPAAHGNDASFFLYLYYLVVISPVDLLTNDRPSAFCETGSVFPPPVAPSY
jgi:hypothetical protein